MNEKQLKKVVGFLIKKIREDEDITQEKMAELIGMSPNNLSAIENGKSAPKLITLYKILTIFKMQPNEFFENLDKFERRSKDFINIELYIGIESLSDTLKSALIKFVELLTNKK